MTTGLTTAGFIILIFMFIVDFVFAFTIGKRLGVKITLKVQRVKGYILGEVDEVLDEWKIIRGKI